MGDNSKIEWTDATWNPIVGCSIVSPGCTNCYAMKMADRLEAMTPKPNGEGNAHLLHYRGTTTRGEFMNKPPVWTGKVALAPDHILTQPLRWRRPRRIFVNSMGDLFHESVPDEWIDRVFAVMALCPQHTFQVLTKRSARMRAYIGGLVCGTGYRPYVRRPGWTAKDPRDGDAVLLLDADQAWPLPNVLIGVSVEDQRRADERREDLAALATSGWQTFVSYEPALGHVDWTGWEFLSWLISGGESGPRARPSHPDWHRAARDFCAAHGIPYLFKQWGEWAVAIDRERDDPDWRADYSRKFADDVKTRWLNLDGGRGFHGEKFHVMRRVGKRAAGRLLDGVEHNGMPTTIARVA
ncbi:phage Gp37/Gp68 family protein [Xanthobacter sp. DSM 24535]|uniref:phage Gp37/Gp68 family protein n=1 Tax=Roseixanthobacter psychrophilus TaxID=3119917 RepID=UPI00372BCDC6